MRIRLAISTCPNDTFAFHGLMHKKVDWRGLDFEIELLDIEALNEGLQQQKFDVAKSSYFAAMQLSQHYWVLPSGSALGFGVGPLLLAACEGSAPSSDQQLTLSPGSMTTAMLLYRMFYPSCVRVQQCLFSEIMPSLVAKRADFGICIHEGRFTYRKFGLSCVEDLGSRWESETGLPLPLGGILSSKVIGESNAIRVQQVIKDSLNYAVTHRDEALESMRKYAQEFDDEVLFQHVDLYVNDWTHDLGELGKRSLATMLQMAKKTKVIPLDQPPLEILCG